ncbi:MAG: amidohydrolase family protein [Candidatus Hydrogenedens sp.]|nr:amidohydrolase family protein [Candidatus Hydrogenedens sp.]
MSGTAAGPFGVIDLHAHPMMKTYMLGHKFWKAHNPPAFMFPLCMRTDIDALLDGGVKALLSTCYVVERGLLDDAPPLHYLQHLYPTIQRIFSENPSDMCREQMNHFKQVIRETRKRKGNVIDFAESYDHMHQLMNEGVLAIVQSIEGAHVLEGDMDNLYDFHRRGVGHMIVPHFYPNEATYTVDAIPENMPLRKLGLLNREYHLDRGLTEWGHELIREMMNIGMLVDVTHGTPVMRKECYEIAKNHPKKRPIIMSHVGVYEYAPFAMNPDKDDIRAIADTGGVVGIIAMSYWLSKPEVHSCKEILIKIINHLIQHGGEDVVAFGSDFDGFTGPPKEWKSPRDYNWVRELLKQHYTDAQVEKFLSGNADRALKLGWDAAAN